MPFDDNWPKNGRFVDVTEQYKDDLAHKSIRMERGGEWLPMRFRFAFHVGKLMEFNHHEHVATRQWLAEHMPDVAWSCDTFCGGWFFVEFALPQPATIFRLMKC